MILLITGLLLFLGVHSIRLFAAPWRTALIARFGAARWKLLFSLASAVGLALIAWGYAWARAEPIPVWGPPSWARHVTILLTLPAFILIAAAYVPGNWLKATLGHPMLAGVFVWAAAHLLSNGQVADLLLFESFLIWSAISFRRSRRRDTESGIRYPRSSATRDMLTVAGGTLGWAVFGFVLHGPLIGVLPY